MKVLLMGTYHMFIPLGRDGFRLWMVVTLSLHSAAGLELANTGHASGLSLAQTPVCTEWKHHGILGLGLMAPGLLALALSLQGHLATMLSFCQKLLVLASFLSSLPHM